MAGERDIHYPREVFVELIGNNFAQFRGVKFPFGLYDVSSVLDSADNRGVRAWPADAFFFQGLDQRRFVIPRRRFGEMLLSLYIHRRKFLSHIKRRQMLLFRRRRPDLRKTVEHECPPGRPENTLTRRCIGADLNIRHIPPRRRHLRRHKPPPYQIIKPELLITNQWPYILRS